MKFDAFFYDLQRQNPIYVFGYKKKYSWLKPSINHVICKNVSFATALIENEAIKYIYIYIGYVENIY